MYDKNYYDNLEGNKDSMYDDRHEDNLNMNYDKIFV